MVLIVLMKSNKALNYSHITERLFMYCSFGLIIELCLYFILFHLSNVYPIISPLNRSS